MYSCTETVNALPIRQASVAKPLLNRLLYSASDPTSGSPCTSAGRESIGLPGELQL